MIMELNVKSGICTGRNGTYEISKMQVSHFGNHVRIDGISAKKGTILNGGFEIDLKAAKELLSVLMTVLP
jgi:hypothetical protein